MNDCVWAVSCLSEEGKDFKKILVNHQIRKTQTIVEIVQARLQVFTNVAANFYGISLLQNWQTESWNDMRLLESPIGHLLRTDVHVISDLV